MKVGDAKLWVYSRESGDDRQAAKECRTCFLYFGLTVYAVRLFSYKAPRISGRRFRTIKNAKSAIKMTLFRILSVLHINPSFMMKVGDAKHGSNNENERATVTARPPKITKPVFIFWPGCLKSGYFLGYTRIKEYSTRANPMLLSWQDKIN